MILNLVLYRCNSFTQRICYRIFLHLKYLLKAFEAYIGLTNIMLETQTY